MTPALSYSRAKRILQSPAKLRWELDHPPPPRKAVFDFGRAAHAYVLGRGDPVHVVDVETWATKAAKEERDLFEALGFTVVKAEEWRTALAMAATIRAHPVAGALFNPATGGEAERLLEWVDERTGCPLKVRVDWLPPVVDGRRLVIGDYKTAASAERHPFTSSVFKFDYHVQAAFTLAAARVALGVPDAAFLFVTQEREPPYEIATYEPSAEVLAVGRDRMSRAVDVWLRCHESGVWPGLPVEVQSVELPRWAGMQHDDDVEAWTADEESAPW